MLLARCPEFECINSPQPEDASASNKAQLLVTANRDQRKLPQLSPIAILSKRLDQIIGLVRPRTHEEHGVLAHFTNRIRSGVSSYFLGNRNVTAKRKPQSGP